MNRGRLHPPVRKACGCMRVTPGAWEPLCRPEGPSHSANPDPGTHGAPSGGRLEPGAWTPGTTSSFLCDPGLVATPLWASVSSSGKWPHCRTGSVLSTERGQGLWAWVGGGGLKQWGEAGLQNILSAAPSRFENRKRALGEPPAVLPEPPPGAGWGRGAVCRRPGKTRCAFVFLSQPRWQSRPEVCAHMFRVPRMGVTHLSQCGEQPVRVGVGVGVCHQRTVPCADQFRPVLTGWFVLPGAGREEPVRPPRASESPGPP